MSQKQFAIPILYWPLVLSAFLICWTLLVSPHTKYGDTWALIPILLVILAVIAVHVGLLVKSGWTVGLVVYGLLHIAFVFALAFWSLTLISKDSL
jgi:hypothetical protein